MLALLATFLGPCSPSASYLSVLVELRLVLHHWLLQNDHADRPTHEHHQIVRDRFYVNFTVEAADCATIVLLLSYLDLANLLCLK